MNIKTTNLKILYAVVVFLTSFFPARAQEKNPIIDSKQKLDMERDSIRSIYHEIQGEEVKSKKLNIFIVTRSGFNVQSYRDRPTQVNFLVSQLRLDINGNLTENIFYRLRQRLNRAAGPENLDNLSTATDMMYVGYNFGDKFSLIFGKQAIAWGGFEFDYNPIYVYQYSDIMSNMGVFKVGSTFTYKFSKRNNINFQIGNTNNSRLINNFSKGMYETSNLQTSTAPLSYIVDWNGAFFENDMIETKWSFAVQNEAKGYYSKSLALGTKLNLPYFALALDYLRSDFPIDRIMLATRYTTQFYNNNIIAKSSIYNSFIMKAEYFFMKKWTYFFKGMYETTSLPEDKNFGNNFRKSYGYITGVEFSPFPHQDLKLFLTYVGRSFQYKDQLTKMREDIFRNYNTNRFFLGVIYNIKAF
ncbi:MAG: porin [Bergeyella sp.]|nr:porin [Bergeyella sp.]